MIMCVLLCYPVSVHMSQLLSTGRPISSYCHKTFYKQKKLVCFNISSKYYDSCVCRFSILI